MYTVEHNIEHMENVWNTFTCVNLGKITWSLWALIASSFKMKIAPYLTDLFSWHTVGISQCQVHF